MGKVQKDTFSRGSVWHRWDPHIHTPGTILYDKFKGNILSFITQIEASDPQICALGITDYLCIDRYEDIQKHKREGRLQNVGFIFPNVEMRLNIEIGNGSGVNAHFLFSPQDPEHILKIKRALERLQFSYLKENYCCCRTDLIRLGKVFRPELWDDKSALETGVNQFKVTFEQVKQLFEASDWLKQNCLFAVAAGESDGTSGMRDHHDSFAALRKSIESYANIIFSGSPAQTEFWLGHRGANATELETIWGGVKPCLHGSDAHSEDRVGNPDGQRFCWIKGDLDFESLIQACIEPEGRVHIGPHPPRGALPAHTIRSLRVKEAPWMQPSEIIFNPGLVAVIGARGSGKTALLDMVAIGGLASFRIRNDSSFLLRAKNYLINCSTELEWENNQLTTKDIRDIDSDESWDEPKVQYLSQQFVEELCSSERLAEPLINEIQRVIFNAHPLDDRLNTSSFDELYHLRTSTALEKRNRYVQELETTSRLLVEERQLKLSVRGLEKKRSEIEIQIKQDQIDLQSMVGKDQDDHARRHKEINTALEQRRRELALMQIRLRAIDALKEDVKDIRSRRVTTWLTEMIENRVDVNLTEKEWDKFRLEFIGDVDSILKKHFEETTAVCNQITRKKFAQVVHNKDRELPSQIVPDSANLSKLPIEVLHQELLRLGKLIGIDQQNTKRYSALSDKISKAKKELETINSQILKAKTADDRIEKYSERRAKAYTGVFTAINEFANELIFLYDPLSKKLNDSSGSLNQLSFYIKRQVDINKWADIGENLLDLRKNGPFKGHGALLNCAKKKLLPFWETGKPNGVSKAMLDFIKENESSLREHRPEGENIGEWVIKISRWLHSTDHITISYGLRYSGVDIEQLSPGTRGIVLLLLYLAIDEEDDRPLIIDQPEENLDPLSVYSELVGRFKETKKRRQIIIVTHNANLVVNTDADQIIVASAEHHQQGELPNISYHSGCLESPSIRKKVCEILEGGERAFKERAKRLRIRI